MTTLSVGDVQEAPTSPTRSKYLLFYAQLKESVEQYRLTSANIRLRSNSSLSVLDGVVLEVSLSSTPRKSSNNP